MEDFSLSSNRNVSLKFLNRKLSPLIPSTPRFLTVIVMAPPKPGGKAKKGKATPTLGAKGVNIMAFCKDYNARITDKAGYVIPVEINVYDDKSFTLILKTPPASVLLLKASLLYHLELFIGIFFKLDVLKRTKDFLLD
ncbi:hypothetical protein V6N13_111100 [Hibiscus sabdariffa]